MMQQSPKKVHFYIGNELSDELSDENKLYFNRHKNITKINNNVDCIPANISIHQQTNNNTTIFKNIIVKLLLDILEKVF